MDILEFSEPLLTFDEEVTLAKSIEAGLLARQALDEGNPRYASAAELRELVRIGEEAHGRLIRANLRLVAYVVRTWHSTPETREELFQEGVLGLLEAIRRFDYRRGFRLATLALTWIRMRVGNAVATQCGRVGIPTGRAKAWRQAHARQSAMSMRLGRTPTVGELAASWGRSREWVAELLSWQPPTLLPPEVAAGPSGSEDARTAAPNTKRLLAALPAGQRTVIQLRFGLAGGEAMSAKEVAAELGMSESTVRRRERVALDTLRSMLEPTPMAA